MEMTSKETQAVVTLALMAAFVDGDKHEREREEIKRIAEGLSQHDALHLPTLYQDVLMKRVSLADATGQLQSADSKRLAYEMAVCVCDADGAHSKAEQLFLTDLRSSLGLAAGAVAAFTQQAGEMASAPLAASVPGAAVAVTVAGAGAVTVPDNVELDTAILNAAILNGALELLPETLSTMAIIPLQMKLVYRIGKAHGFELDRGHIKDFIATVGVGLTSQYLEQAGRKLLGGLLGKVGGGLLGGMLSGTAKQAVSSGMSFATTYALGHVAKRYYAGGRTLSTQMLKDAYADVVQEAQGLQTRYLPDMQEKARTLNPASVLTMIRKA
ncbi:hypothetical protein BH11PSE13_BH11PSE13_43820 [soil metagenome]